MHDQINTSQTEILRILADFTGNDDYLKKDGSAELGELGLDSLGIFQALLEIEKRLAFRIPDQNLTLSGLVTIADLIELVNKAKTARDESERVG